MSRTHSPSPLLARSADSSALQGTSKPPQRARPGERLLPRDADPDDVLPLLRSLIETDQIERARQLTFEAVRRFPGHEQIRLARHILSVSKATPNRYVQPTATAEIEWLENPPEEARGKWVALIGRDLVAMADSPQELRTVLQDKKFDQYPVVQHLAP